MRQDIGWDQLSNSISIQRVRYFYRFQRAETLDVELEITYENMIEDDLYYLPYELDREDQGFKPFLRIHDYDDELLDFFTTDNSYQLFVQLPESKKLGKGERRTIRLKYFKEFAPTEQELMFIFEIPVYSTANVYVYFEKYKNYKYKIEYFVATDEAPYPTITPNYGNTYASLKIGKFDVRTPIHLIYTHEKPAPIPPSKFDVVVGILGWNNFGIGIGFFSCLFLFIIRIVMFINKSKIMGFTDAVTFATLIVTVLVIIEGWLIDKSLSPNQLAKYDLVYKAMIGILFVEMLTFI
jgi:hypothetical protein